MSKKTKIWLLSGLGALAVLAIVLAVWQPWKEEEPEETPGTGQAVDKDEAEPEEKGLVLTVGNEEIPAVRYTGDGWSILVPETWKQETVEESAIFTQDDRRGGPQVLVSSASGYLGAFMSLAPEEGENGPGLARRFYSGSVEGGWQVSCRAPAEDWDQTEKLLTAVARSFTLGETTPFARLYPVAVKPDWQNDEGHTALFLDKSGYLVEEGTGDAVRDHMLAWSDEVKKCFTGQYRLEDLTWAGSYTGIGQGYIDIFAAPVWYERAEGEELPLIIGSDWVQKSGWVQDPERLAVAICHDGSEVVEKLILWLSDEVPGEPILAGRLAGERGLSRPEGETALTAAELRSLEDYFNARENNGLLRFELDPNAYKSMAENLENYLIPLFYDLGEWDFTGAERKMFQEKIDAGEWLDLDESRLSRKYIADYLYQKFGLDAEATDALLAETPRPPGDYAEEFDAWYMCHGDTEMRTYTFDTGWGDTQKDGSRVVYYTNPYIWGPEAASGERDVPMCLRVTPSPTEDGGWRVVSNTIIK